MQGRLDRQNRCMTNGQLASLASNTKWTELQQRMTGLGPRAPYWRTRATNGFRYPVDGWDGDWSYHFRLGKYKHIEWCEMTPRGIDDGHYQRFATREAAMLWLLEDEYSLAEHVIEEEQLTGLTPPWAPTDKELIPLMSVRGRS